jgi:hypothetical protein
VFFLLMASRISQIAYLGGIPAQTAGSLGIFPRGALVFPYDGHVGILGKLWCLRQSLVCSVYVVTGLFSVDNPRLHIAFKAFLGHARRIRRHRNLRYAVTRCYFKMLCCSFRRNEVRYWNERDALDDLLNVMLRSYRLRRCGTFFLTLRVCHVFYHQPEGEKSGSRIFHQAVAGSII